LVLDRLDESGDDGGGSEWTETADGGDGGGVGRSAEPSGWVSPGLGLPLIGLPPYSPELNPAERVFEEVRRWIEGTVYPSLEQKVEAVAAYLTDLESDPGLVRALCGWDWIEEAIRGLPASLAA
jgi:hypothetical protein